MKKIGAAMAMLVGMASSGWTAEGGGGKFSFCPPRVGALLCDCLLGRGAIGGNPEADKKERALLEALRDYYMSPVISVEENKNILSKIIGSGIYTDKGGDYLSYLSKSHDNIGDIITDEKNFFKIYSPISYFNGSKFMFIISDIKYNNRACLSLDEIIHVFEENYSCKERQDHPRSSPASYPVIFFRSENKISGKAISINFNINSIDDEGNHIGACVEAIGMGNRY